MFFGHELSQIIVKPSNYNHISSNKNEWSFCQITRVNSIDVLHKILEIYSHNNSIKENFLWQPKGLNSSFLGYKKDNRFTHCFYL